MSFPAGQIAYSNTTGNVSVTGLTLSDAAVAHNHAILGDELAFVKAAIKKAGQFSSFQNRIAHGEPIINVIELKDRDGNQASRTIDCSIVHPARFEDMKALHRRMVSYIQSFKQLPDRVWLGDEVFELDRSDWDTYSNADEDTLKRMWLDEVGSAVSLAKRFIAMRWSVLVADRPAFITSDNPVVPIHESLHFRGFGNPGTSILFPLGPKRLLTMDWNRAEPDGAYYAAQPETVAACNYSIWRDNKTMLTGRHPDEVCAELIRHFDKEVAA